MPLMTSVDRLAEHTRTDLGRSRSRPISQHTIDDFARLTGDHQWIHTEPARAAQGPFGATVAHGFLTLALIAPVLEELLIVEGASGQINYGLNKVRFPSPVIVGSEVHGRGELCSVVARDGTVDAVVGVSMWVDGATRPACSAEVVIRFFR